MHYNDLIRLVQEGYREYTNQHCRPLAVKVRGQTAMRLGL
jgi:hypothetical protein